jgi:hypothetical protein
MRIQSREGAAPLPKYVPRQTSIRATTVDASPQFSVAPSCMSTSLDRFGAGLFILPAVAIPSMIRDSAGNLYGTPY